MFEETVRNNEPSIIPGLDVEHRWNSTYDLLKSALRIQKSITSLSFKLVQENKSKEYSVISENDWEVAKNICEFLEPFKTGNE
jgi:hypothetical protein